MNSKATRVRFATLVATGCVAALTLTACGGDSSESEAAPAATTTTSAAPSSSAATSSASASPTSTTAAASSSAAPAAGGAAGKSVPVNKTIDDPEMGDKVVIEEYVRGFPVPASLPAIKDREIILVKVSATAGDKYYAGWQTGSLRLLTANGQENAAGSSTAVVEAMTAAGYPLMKDVKTGKAGAGWLPFVVVQKDSPSLTLQVKRSAATTSGGGTIAAQTWDVPLPTA
ncbi:hypothetical protein [Rhodococcus sp. X156]|uniref:hypothetical protein n=1 Tax=Rhodococcus sp. X156 TaxID=2499145 RepID=UPI0013E39776|nr:hypothetical protein [Rhodococcus sp. X156]